MNELFEGHFDHHNSDHVRAIYEATSAALSLAITGSSEDFTEEEADQYAEQASQIMTSIVMKGVWALYTSCVALCRFAQKQMEKQIGPGENPRQWGFVDVGESEADPAQDFAARFLVAFLNEDPETGMALYRAVAEQGPEAGIEAHMALVKQVVGFALMPDFAKVSKGDPLFDELMEKLGLEDSAPDDISSLTDENEKKEDGE